MNSSYFPIVVTPSDNYPNLASTLSLIALSKSSSSDLDSVDEWYSSSTAAQRDEASSNKFWFLVLLEVAAVMIPDWVTTHLSSSLISSYNPDF